MPLYEYECESCHHRFERIQKYSDPLIDVCPVCGSAVKKLLSSPAFQFKGTGWYVTDYAKKSGSDSGGGKGSSSSSTASSSTESAKTDGSSTSSSSSPAASTSTSAPATDSAKKD